MLPKTVSPRLEEASEDTIETSDIPKVSSFCYSSSKVTAVTAINCKAKSHKNYKKTAVTSPNYRAPRCYRSYL